jgi:hypothetical protein
MSRCKDRNNCWQGSVRLSEARAWTNGFRISCCTLRTGAFTQSLNLRTSVIGSAKALLPKDDGYEHVDFRHTSNGSKLFALAIALAGVVTVSARIEAL